MNSRWHLLVILLVILAALIVIPAQTASVNLRPNAFTGTVQSQAAELPPLTEMGSYGVGIKVLTLTDERRQDWQLETYVWFPADPTKGKRLNPNSPALIGAVPATDNAPYPLIVYSHSWIESNTDLPLMNEYLASQGYVVAAANHHDAKSPRYELVDRPLDILLILDSLAAITEGSLAGMIDTNNVGLLGYDQGAVAALQMLGLLRDPVNFTNWCAEHTLKTWDCAPPQYWTETQGYGANSMDVIAEYRARLSLQNEPDGRWQPFGDERIRAVLAIGPGNFPLTTEDMLAAVTTPTMILFGYKDKDAGLDYENNAVRTYTHLGTEDRYLITLPDSDNQVFKTWQDPVKHFATAFFGCYLKHDVAFEAYLTPEALPWDDRLVWGTYEAE